MWISRQHCAIRPAKLRTSIHHGRGHFRPPAEEDEEGRHRYDWLCVCASYSRSAWKRPTAITNGSKPWTAGWQVRVHAGDISDTGVRTRRRRAVPYRVLSDGFHPNRALSIHPATQRSGRLYFIAASRPVAGSRPRPSKFQLRSSADRLSSASTNQ